MAKIFSEHVQALESGSSVDPIFLSEVKVVLRSELRRRSIWAFGPSLLGYFGRSWDDEEAMSDLAHDCYIRAIASRLRGLLANLKVSGDIEHLVEKNIRAFVGEQQKAFDPQGNALFQNIKATVLELASIRVLKRFGSDTNSISGETQFGFTNQPSNKESEASELKEALKRTGRLFDGLECLVRIGITAQEQLAAALRMLPEFQVVRFSVGTLKQCLRELLAETSVSPNSLRATRFSELTQDFLESFRTTSPDTGYLETEHFVSLIAKAREAIEAQPRSAAVKLRLQKLLAHFAEAISNHETDESETLDSLATRFDVARSTLHEDFQCLRSILQRLTMAN